MVAYIFHSFTEESVVHEFVEVFVEGGSRLCSFWGIEVDVGLEPAGLIEGECSVDVSGDEAEVSVLLEVFIMEYIVLFGVKVLNKFLSILDLGFG